jgi:hypothetical protein
MEKPNGKESEEDGQETEKGEEVGSDQATHLKAWHYYLDSRFSLGRRNEVAKKKAKKTTKKLRKVKKLEANKPLGAVAGGGPVKDPIS